MYPTHRELVEFEDVVYKIYCDPDTRLREVVDCPGFKDVMHLCLVSRHELPNDASTLSRETVHRNRLAWAASEAAAALVTNWQNGYRDASETVGERYAMNDWKIGFRKAVSDLAGDARRRNAAGLSGRRNKKRRQVLRVFGKRRMPLLVWRWLWLQGPQVPLAVDAHRELTRAGIPPAWANRICAYITGRRGYRAALARSAWRYDLDGNPVQRTTVAERNHAHRLAQMQAAVEGQRMSKRP